MLRKPDACSRHISRCTTCPSAVTATPQLLLDKAAVKDANGVLRCPGKAVTWSSGCRLICGDQDQLVTVENITKALSCMVHFLRWVW